MSAVRPASVTEDRYPSRVGAPPALVERHDPVVHGDRDGPLAPGQVAEYDERGFLVLPGLFSPAEVEALDGALDDYIAGVASLSDERLVVEPGSNEIRSIFAFHADGGPLGAVACSDRLAGVARQLLGSDVYVHQSRVNRKPGFRGEDFQWHSDFETWHTEDGMPAPRCLSAVVALTENHTWNGSLLVMPGSHRWYVTCPDPTPPANHRQSLVAQRIGVPDEDSLSELFARCGIETCTGPAGSVLFFDSNMMHGSSSNISPLARRNLFVVYNSVENRLVEPFAAPQRRPEHLGARDFTPC